MKIKLAGVVAALMALSITLAGCSSSGSGGGSSSGPSPIQKFVGKETQNAAATSRDVASILTEVNGINELDSTAMTQLASDAQTLHGHLTDFRQQLLLDASVDNSDQLKLVTAENDLKAATGSLDVWTGDSSNASANAKWQREMGTGVGEWNAAVAKLWSLAHATPIPTITSPK